MDNETKDILMTLMERIDNGFKGLNERIGEVEKKVDKLDEQVKASDLKQEIDIKPTLQLILENQTEVINQKSHITEVETKVDEVKDDVDVLKIVVTEHSNDLEQLKKRA